MGVREKVTNPPETPFYADSNKLLLDSIALILTEILTDFDHSLIIKERLLQKWLADIPHHEKKAEIMERNKIQC